MCYLELPRVPINNRSINKTLQSLINTYTRQRTAYSKRKVTKLWEHFPRFSDSKRALCNRKVFFRPRLPIDAKEENVRNGLAWVLSLFPCLGSQIPEHSEILEDYRAWPSGVSAGHIIPQWELCNYRGFASFPKQTHNMQKDCTSHYQSKQWYDKVAFKEIEMRSYLETQSIHFIWFLKAHLHDQ